MNKIKLFLNARTYKQNPQPKTCTAIIKKSKKKVKKATVLPRKTYSHKNKQKIAKTKTNLIKTATNVVPQQTTKKSLKESFKANSGFYNAFSRYQGSPNYIKWGGSYTPDINKSSKSLKALKRWENKSKELQTKPSKFEPSSNNQTNLEAEGSAGKDKNRNRSQNKQLGGHRIQQAAQNNLRRNKSKMCGKRQGQTLNSKSISLEKIECAKIREKIEEFTADVAGGSPKSPKVSVDLKRFFQIDSRSEKRSASKKILNPISNHRKGGQKRQFDRFASSEGKKPSNRKNSSPLISCKKKSENTKKMQRLLKAKFKGSTELKAYGVGKKHLLDCKFSVEVASELSPVVHKLPPMGSKDCIEQSRLKMDPGKFSGSPKYIKGASAVKGSRNGVNISSFIKNGFTGGRMYRDPERSENGKKGHFPWTKAGSGATELSHSVAESTTLRSIRKHQKSTCVPGGSHSIISSVNFNKFEDLMTKTSTTNMPGGACGTHLGSTHRSQTGAAVQVGGNNKSESGALRHQKQQAWLRHTHRDLSYKLIMKKKRKQHQKKLKSLAGINFNKIDSSPRQRLSVLENSAQLVSCSTLNSPRNHESSTSPGPAQKEKTLFKRWLDEHKKRTNSKNLEKLEHLVLNFESSETKDISMIIEFCFKLCDENENVKTRLEEANKATENLIEVMTNLKKSEQARLQKKIDELEGQLQKAMDELEETQIDKKSLMEERDIFKGKVVQAEERIGELMHKLEIAESSGFDSLEIQQIEEIENKITMITEQHEEERNLLLMEIVSF